MKKYYEAPRIEFEDFSLSTNIAGTCELVTDNPSSAASCAYVYDDRGIETHVFTEGVSGCHHKPAGGIYNGFCYHVPSENGNLFNS